MSDTKPESTEIIKPKAMPTSESMDDYIANVSLFRTIGQVVAGRDTAGTTKTFFVMNLFFSAVFDMDISLISEIVKRIDGTAPEKGGTNGCSSIFSDALNDVLNYEDAKRLTIFPDDPAIIALAKATVCIANSDPGMNMQARKDRQKAVQMILDRTEGRRNEPAKPTVAIEYKEPDWMSLPNGENNEGKAEC